MNSSPLVSQRHGDRSVFTQVEVVVVVMVVRSYPSNPHASRVLASKDPHRVVVLESQRQEIGSVCSPNKGLVVVSKPDCTVVMLP